MAGPAIQRPAWRTLAQGALLAFALAAVAYLASIAVHDWLNPSGPSPVSPVLCAVLLGVIWRNTIGLGAGFVPVFSGSPTISAHRHRPRRAQAVAERRAGFNSHDGAARCARLHHRPAIGVSVLVGKMFGLQPLQLLLAAGTSVCGCTAICAMTPVVRARAVESGLALTCVVVARMRTGMLLYPWLAHFRVRRQHESRGRYSSGTSIHDTSQVMGASMIYAQQFNAADAVPIAGVHQAAPEICRAADSPCRCSPCGLATAAGAKRYPERAQ